MYDKEILIQKVRPEITECRILQIEDLEDEKSEEQAGCSTEQ